MEREIEVFNIGRTMVDRAEVKRWLDFIGAEDFEIPEDGAISNPALLVALAAKRCYMSFNTELNPNISKIRKDYGEYLDNVLASKHGSVLEHAVYNFAIENITRVFTAEMNRHRAGWAISEGSLRFIRFDKEVPFWMPLSLQDQEDDDPHLTIRKEFSRQVFREAFEHQQKMYRRLLEVWDMDDTDKNFTYKKKVTSCLRRIVGMGVCTGGVWSGNLRALRHVLTMRCSPAAEEEIQYVFGEKIMPIMLQREPMIFEDFDDSEGYWKPKYDKV